MQPTYPQQLYYPNKMGRIVLQAMEEVIGRHGVNAILNLSRQRHLIDHYPPNNLAREFSFYDLSMFLEATEDLFGFNGGRGLTLRAGRESWKYALREFMPVLGISDLATRRLPLGIKLKIGLDVFAQTFNKFSDQRVRLSEDDHSYLWIIEQCPMCWQRSATTPSCHLATGLLDEALFWVSKGRRFQVQEVACIAKGDETCTIVISKKPLQ